MVGREGGDKPSGPLSPDRPYLLLGAVIRQVLRFAQSQVLPISYRRNSG